jgi:hypothetical protein
VSWVDGLDWLKLVMNWIDGLDWLNLVMGWIDGWWFDWLIFS